MKFTEQFTQDQNIDFGFLVRKYTCPEVYLMEWSRNTNQLEIQIVKTKLNILVTFQSYTELFHNTILMEANRPHIKNGSEWKNIQSYLFPAREKNE